MDVTVGVLIVGGSYLDDLPLDEDGKFNRAEYPGIFRWFRIYVQEWGKRNSTMRGL